MLSLANPWMILALVVALGASAAGGAKLGSDHQIAKQSKTEALIAAVKEQALQGAAAAIALNRPRHTTIQQRAETILRESKVYTECVNGPELERLLDAARNDGIGTVTPGSGIVPLESGSGVTP